MEAEGSAWVVLIVASGTSEDALTALLSSFPDTLPAIVIVALSMERERATGLTARLAEHVALPVSMVTDQAQLTPGSIAMIPQDHHVNVADRTLSLSGEDGGTPSRTDVLMRRAAEAYGEDLIVVLLAGLGADGVEGTRMVRMAGGMVIVQRPGTSLAPGISPALAPSHVDVFAPIEAIGSIVYGVITADGSQQFPQGRESLQGLLDHLREEIGIDFKSYKMPTIMRRLQRRLIATGTSTLTTYLRYLRLHPTEYQRLVSSFLIKVTEFFRNGELFDYLRDELIPELVRHAQSHGQTIRIWSAGCATGEEAYSLAILLAEHLGEELEQYTIRIFATDLDGDAVAFARRGVYSAASLAQMPEELLARYFVAIEDEYVVDKRIRSLLIFGQHDLGQRSPFPHIDLTLCRNVLIYFTPELQKRALRLFAYSLRQGGYLILGKSETTNPLPEFFTPVDQHLKVYRRHGERVLFPPGQVKDSSQHMVMLPALRPQMAGPVVSERGRPSGLDRRPAHAVADRLILQLATGVVLVDRRYDIEMINPAARRFFGIQVAGIGEDFLHLVQNVPQATLRAAIDRTFRDQSGHASQSPAISEHMIAVDAATRESFHLHLVFLPQRSSAESGRVESVLIQATDVTALERTYTERLEETRTQLTKVRQENQHLVDQESDVTDRLHSMTDAYQRLQEANEELSTQNMVLAGENEEYAIISEEAQAATEEVETLNEEMQATNEELETLNEELQSTVEELHATNEDLESRTFELQDLALASEEKRVHIEAILAGIGDAVVVVDSLNRVILTNGAYNHIFPDAHGMAPLADEQGNPIPIQDTPQYRAARGDTFVMQFQFTSPDGAHHWYEASGQPIRVASEHQGVVVIRDVTDRSLRHMQEQFLALASHELRTPLTVLQGSVARLTTLLPRDSDPRLREYASAALTRARQMTRLVSDLLDAARLQSGRFTMKQEPVDLVPLVAQGVEAAQALTEGQQIRLESVASPLVVLGDAGRIEQVLLNLLTNAIRYAANTPYIDIRLRHSEHNALLDVRDYGPGMPEDKLQAVFLRFVQIEHVERATQGGLGLGLFLCKEIVTAHGGTIKVHSKVDQGATFTVCLPLLEAAQ